MKILIMDGSSSGDETAKRVVSKVVDMVEKSGHEQETLNLEQIDINGCTGCFSCWIRTPGECIIDDDGRMVARKMMWSDLMVWISPVTFGGYSYELKKALDRIIPNIMPFFIKINGELHHSTMYDTYPSIYVIGLTNDREQGEIFKQMVSRNAINFHAPSHLVDLFSDDQDQDMGIELRESLAKLGVRT
jgi:multimeric flavodoxin WrbA